MSTSITHIHTQTQPTITEGSVTIYNPNGAFYNPVQVMNRDLSIAAISVFERIRRNEIKSKNESRSSRTDDSSYSVRGLRILEALAATGLRSIRYFNELSGVDFLMVNDLMKDAVDNIKANFLLNKIESTRVSINQGDACEVMYSHRSHHLAFDVIDLDPYGSANIFMDTAVQSIAKGGMLCVTCTDLAVLAGTRPMACFAKYGVMPHRAKYCHEMALRIVLASLSRAAGRHGRYIVPLLSTSIDFYVRLFVRVYPNKEQAWLSSTRVAHVLQCTACESFFTQPIAREKIQAGKHGKPDRMKLSQALIAPHGSTCSDCGKSLKIAGPFWMAPIHDKTFAECVRAEIAQRTDTEAIPASRKLLGVIKVVCDELIDTPLFYDLSSMCQTLHCTMPSAIEFRSAIVNAGYLVSQTHCSPSGFKTNAPSEVLWDILRCWVKSNPVRQQPECSASYSLLSKQPKLLADFTIVHSQRTIKGCGKWMPNPQSDWGPKSRAKPAIKPKSVGGIKRAHDCIANNSDLCEKNSIKLGEV